MKKKILLAAAALLIALLAAAGILLLSGRTCAVAAHVQIQVPAGCTYDGLADSLCAHGYPARSAAFRSAARLCGLTSHVEPGNYLIEPGTNVLRVAHRIHAGRQTPVRLVLNKERTLADLCQFFGARLMLSPDTLLARLSDEDFCGRYGQTPQTIIGLFVPNTYEVYWTVTPEELVSRMDRESERFWKSRKAKCEAMGLTPNEVLILASIVEEETNKNDEKADIASVYLNRLRRGMPLQADPTVKYAVGDFAIRRVSGSMLDNPSPYNTYRHIGLPPGPICTPSLASIEAVLQDKQTGYLYFCAKEDFSGYHRFSADYAQHQHNAALFHKSLNRNGIK